jgi:hypothetical protein
VSSAGRDSVVHNIRKELDDAAHIKAGYMGVHLVMRSSRTITLFADPPPLPRGRSSFLVSILLHGVALGLLALGLRHASRATDQSLAQRYTVRILNLRRTEPKMRWSAQSGAAHPATQAVARAVSPGGQPAAPSTPRQLAQLVPAPQTLVQPDLPPNLTLPKEIPIPLVLMWSAENSPARKIVPPPPREATAANVRPSLDAPNHELKVADLKISPSVFATDTPSLPPSTSSPLSVRGPELAKRVPETASQSAGQPTPARVMSLSELRLSDGPIAIPLANETAPASSSGALAPGRGEGTSVSGSGNPSSKEGGIGPGQNSGDQGDKADAHGPAGQNGAKTGSNDGSDAGSGSGSEPAVARITLPKDGHFGVVVVGSSLAEEYPETVGIWSGRLAYTVYLHVGLAKSWILQYSLPRSAEADAAGSATRPDAPWPYLIVRPHLAAGDSNADAIMVHGFVNAGGRFEHLAVVFPPQCAQTKFLLSSLEQWQFRPAMQQAQMTAVEVLLIIPDAQE